MLLGLAALPAIWWLLRLTPPTPQHVVFPPTRLRVWAWYDAIFCGLEAAGLMWNSGLGPRPSLESRAYAAWEYCWNAMLAHVGDDAPLIDYETLCTGESSEVTDELNVAWLREVIDLPAAVAEINAWIDLLGRG